MDVEDRGQNLEVGGRKSEVSTEGFSCGSGFPAAILRFQRFERV